MIKRTAQMSCLLLFMLLFFCNIKTLGEEIFQIRRIGNIHPYADNVFQIHSTESGELTIRIHDNICTYRILKENITAGETSVHWDGCGYNLEKLYEKTYTVTSVLKTESGLEQTISFNSPVEYPLQCLSYALPSSNQLYLDAQDRWFLEYRTVKDGKIRMELFSEGETEPVCSYQLTTAGGKILKKDFESISGKNKPCAGRYSVKVYEISRQEDKHIFSLDIIEHMPSSPAVTETGEIMPERSMSENEIWDLMMRPSVVVDTDYFKHQEVYETPQENSRSLGTVHGQTQGLKVIRIENEWVLVGAWNHEDAEYIEGWVPLSRLKVETPRDEYGILIDKKKQTLSVFHEGKIIDTLLVSTGKAEKNKLYQETSAGCFLTGYHRVNFSMNGKKYDYVIQYDGGNLLHQTPYDWGQYKKDFTLGRGYLGAKASHACIRIQAEPGRGGINAYWLFTHIPYHTRVIILDDPDERKAESEMLRRTEKSEMNQASLHYTEANEKNDDQTVILTFGGCLIPGGNDSFNHRKESFSAFVSKQGYDIPFSRIRSVFAEDDLTCVSLICPIGDTADHDPNDRKTMSASPGMEELFRDASIELIQMTDDQLVDVKTNSYQYTAETLKSYAKILERGQTSTVMLKGHLFGFAGCSELQYLADPGLIDRLVSELKEMACERIIFLTSWGEDRNSTHSIIQEAMAHRCARAGADLIVGNHRGVIQGIDYFEDTPVAYSLGNLLDGSTSAKPKKQEGILLQVLFSFESQSETCSLSIIPILPYGDSKDQNNEYCPSAEMPQADTQRIIKTIWQDTKAPVMEKISFRLDD